MKRQCTMKKRPKRGNAAFEETENFKAAAVEPLRNGEA